MAKGTDFGGVHSSTDLYLIQQKVSVQPAEPKLKLIDIPGANGSKDLTDRPSGRVVYKDRKITWIFALYPGENWDVKHRQVSNALNGRYCKITLDSDPDYYYEGRVVIKKYNIDKMLRQITIEATCKPYMMKQNDTIVTGTVYDYWTDFIVPNERKAVVPTIITTVETNLFYQGTDYVLAAGTTKNMDIELLQGNNVLRIRTVEEDTTGEITLIYQEGSL